MSTADVDLKSTIRNVCMTFPIDLKVVHLNAQSLADTSHNSEFKHIFASDDNYKVDIIAVSETFLKPNHPDTVVQISNFNVYRNDRKDRNCGGVAVFVKDSLKSRVLCYSTSPYPINIHTPEYIILEIELRQMKILFACIYRPPKVGHMNLFENDLFTHLFNYKYTIIAGDMNARFGSESFETENILEMLTMCNLSRVPFGNTFHTAKTDSNLDVIASNCPELLIKYGQSAAPGFSGHDLIYAVYSLSTPTFHPRMITYRDFKNFNTDAFLEQAHSLPWHEIIMIPTIDEKVDLFNTMLLDLYDRHAPLRTTRATRPPTPWMTNDIIRMMRKRTKARRTWVRSKNVSDFENFRTIRNKVKQEIRNSKIKYMHELFKSSKSTADNWKSVRMLGVGKQQQSSSNFPFTPDTLNTHFTNVASVSDPSRINATIERYCSLPVPNSEPFFFSFVYPSDIIFAVKSVKSKVKGHDEISGLLISKCLEVILPVLEHIFNFSLQSSVFPSQWKRANVIPVPKIKNPLSCSDIRPVSILPFLSKVLEKVVHNQMRNYLQIHDILDPYQSGFRNNHSTTTALIKITDDIRFAMDRRELTSLVLFDYSKAFDCVHHELLLTKLRYIGFSNSVVQWFRSYLTARSQRIVHKDGKRSEWKTVSTGVPQGSVLAPIIFALYVNDISHNFLHSRYHLYADDLQIYLHFSPLCLEETLDLLNEDICRLVSWSYDHNLVLNSEKTQFIIFGHTRILNQINHTTDSHITVDGKTVIPAPTVRNLGLIMDSTLSWSSHVHSTIQKVTSTICQLRRNLDFLPVRIRKILVQSLVFPILEYSSPAINDISETLNTKLQRSQNACVRFVLNIRRDEHITPYFIKLGWLKLKDKRNLSTAELALRIICNKSPKYLVDRFTSQSSIHNRNNRYTNSLLQIPHHRTSKCSGTFSITACKLWNSLNLQQLISKSSRYRKNYIHGQLFSKY